MEEGGLGDAGLEGERHSFVDKERKFYKILRCVNCRRPAPPDLRRANGRECSHHGLDVDWENKKWQQFGSSMAKICGRCRKNVPGAPKKAGRRRVASTSRRVSSKGSSREDDLLVVGACSGCLRVFDENFEPFPRPTWWKARHSRALTADDSTISCCRECWAVGLKRYRQSSGAAVTVSAAASKVI